MILSLTQIELIVVFAVSCLIVLFERDRLNPKGYYVCALGFLLIWICANRPESMADYANYSVFFQSIDLSRFEPGFIFIRRIARHTSNPVFWGFLITAFLSISIRLYAIKKISPFFWGSIVVYLSYIFILQDMITIRAGIASAFLLFIIMYKEKAEYVKMLICYALAMLFHQTAAIFFIVFFMSKDNPRAAFYLSFLVLSYLLALLGIRFGYLIQYIPTESVSSLFESYEYSNANIFNLIQLGRIAICIAGWVIVGKIKTDSNSTLFLKCYTVGLGIVALLSDYLTIAYRFSELLLSVEIFLIPVIFHGLFKKELTKRIVLIVYSVIIFYISINSIQFWSPLA